MEPEKVHNRKTEMTIVITTALVALLFFYAAFSKLMDYDRSQWEMQNQVFPKSVANVLTGLVPSVEIVLMLGLLFPTTRIKALWGSLLLLVAFTLYIAIVMTNVFGRIPCSCGGIIGKLPYSVHLIFNLFWVAIALVGLNAHYGWKKDIPFRFKRRKEVARN